MSTKRHNSPPPQHSTPSLPPKPLWHFGWRGWVLLPIALVLAVVYFTGYDLRTVLLTEISKVFGIDPVMWLVTVGMPFHALDVVFTEDGFVPQARFGLITMSLVLVAMAIHPKRFAWWLYLCVFALGILLPPLLIQGTISINRMLGTGTHYGGWQTILSDVIARSAAVLLTLALLWIITRSRITLMYILATGILSIWMQAQSLAAFSHGRMIPDSPVVTTLSVLLDIGWNPVLFGILLWWAIKARKAYAPL